MLQNRGSTWSLVHLFFFFKWSYTLHLIDRIFYLRFWFWFLVFITYCGNLLGTVRLPKFFTTELLPLSQSFRLQRGIIVVEHRGGFRQEKYEVGFEGKRKAARFSRERNSMSRNIKYDLWRKHKDVFMTVVEGVWCMITRWKELDQCSL